MNREQGNYYNRAKRFANKKWRSRKKSEKDFFVIPAKTGIQEMQEVLDSRSPPAQGQASRERRPLDSGHGLWPWALARGRVPSEGKSSRGRPERSAAKSKGNEVGALGSAGGTHYGDFSA